MKASKERAKSSAMFNSITLGGDSTMTRDMTVKTSMQQPATHFTGSRQSREDLINFGRISATILDSVDS